MWASEEEVRVFIQDMSALDYTKQRPSNMPLIQYFPNIYGGKTFATIRDGFRGRYREWASEAELRFFIGKMSVKEYRKKRLYNMPTQGAMNKIYGKTYAQIRTGRDESRGQKPH